MRLSELLPNPHTAHHHTPTSPNHTATPPKHHTTHYKTFRAGSAGRQASVGCGCVAREGLQEGDQVGEHARLHQVQRLEGL